MRVYRSVVNSGVTLANEFLLILRGDSTRLRRLLLGWKTPIFFASFPSLRFFFVLIRDRVKSGFHLKRRQLGVLLEK